MSGRIEDYAVIGNCETMALVGKDGSIDWLCLPRFDSPACFAALVGDDTNGRWLISPADEGARATRRYLGNTLVLETTFETDCGKVSVTDFMARRDGASDVIRVVRGLSGEVPMRTDLAVRFDYGSTVPWVTRRPDGRLQLISGPDRLLLDATVELRGRDMRTAGTFEIKAGEEATFVLSWSSSIGAEPGMLDAKSALQTTKEFWQQWSSTYKSSGEYCEAVLRSLIVLKGLSHWQTGGIVAAPTTSLPEQLGGTRNWDYRYCWLRDTTFTLYALVETGFLDEARAWREWLLRAAAGSPSQIQILYGVAGERWLGEYEAGWLSGYQGAKPVRIGNAAANQIQLDVFGEIIEAMYLGRKKGLPAVASSWDFEIAILQHLENIWDQPDDGIWEVRGGRKQFTHSKVMAWVAFDRAIRSAQEFELAAPLERWIDVRDRIHKAVCENGFNANKNSFVQHYGSDALDAALLLIPLVGFLPPADPRVKGTVAAVERELMRDGLVTRYDTDSKTDGLPPGEGAFLACSFWLVDNYVLQGRYDDARALFERLLKLRNDVGLLSEEYDPDKKRLVGNFPQAFSHLALINSARNITTGGGPAKDRSAGASDEQSADQKRRADQTRAAV